MPLVDKLLLDHKRELKMWKPSVSQLNAFYRRIYSDTYRNDYKLKYELLEGNTLYIEHDFDILPLTRPPVSDILDIPEVVTSYTSRYGYFKGYYVAELGWVKKDVDDMFFNKDLSLKLTVYGDDKTLKADNDDYAKTVTECLEKACIIENDNRINHLNVIKTKSYDDSYKTKITLGVL